MRYRDKMLNEVGEAVQWFPGIEIPEVEISPASDGWYYFWWGGDPRKVQPGSWVVTFADGIDVYTEDEFLKYLEPVPDEETTS